MNLLYALTLGNANWKKLEEFGYAKIFNTTSTTEIIDRVRDAEVIITNKVKIVKNV